MAAMVELLRGLPLASKALTGVFMLGLVSMGIGMEDFAMAVAIVVVTEAVRLMAIGLEQGSVEDMATTTDTYKPKMMNLHLVSVTVTGGDMLIPQVVSQLQRLVPTENLLWEVTQVGHNLFQVQFPSRNELDRLKVFGTCRVPNSPCEITVDDWSKTIEPVDTLPEIWVCVSGIPEEHLGDYLAMWALGDMFGRL